MKILHIEDNINVISLAKAMLKLHEFKAIRSHKKVSSKDLKWADIILLDLRLDHSSEEFNGMDVLEMLKKEKIKKKAVLLTALSEPAKNAKKKYPKEILGIIIKPFLKKDLDEFIKEGKK